MSHASRFRTVPDVRSDSRWSLIIGLGVLITGATAGYRSARAVDYTWNGSHSESFALSVNWTPFGHPDDNTDNAIFLAVPSSAYDVTWSSSITNRSLEVRAGDVTLSNALSSSHVFTLDSGSSPSAVIGSVAGPLTQLTLPSQSPSHRFEASGPLRIADAVGSNGKLTLGQEWDSTSVVIVGWHGTGELEFTFGGFLKTAGGTIGVFAESRGTVTAGIGNWSNTGDLTVGSLGVGLVNISGSGEISNDGNGYIGRESGSTGSVVVTGGLWQNNASVYVGGDAGGLGGGGAFTVTTGGTVNIVNLLKIYPGRAVVLHGGTLNTGTLSGGADTISWTAGEINITNGDLTIDSGEPLGNNRAIDSDQTLSASGLLNVGVNVGATFTVIGGGTVTSGSGLIGSVDAGSVLSTARITGGGSTWTLSGNLEMRSVNGANLILEDGGVMSNQDALIASPAGTTADVDLTGADTQWNSSGSVYLGGDAVLAGGAGDLRIFNGAEMHVAGTLTIWHNYYSAVSSGGVLTASNLDLHGGLAIDAATVEILGGTVNVIDADAMLEGAIDIQGSAMNITGGGQFYGTILGDGNTHVTLQDVGSLWWTEAPLNLGTIATGSNQIGTLTVPTGAVVTVEGAVTLLTPGALALTGGTIDAPEFDLGGADFQGWGALNGRVLGGAAVITATGDLTMGNAMDPVGFFHAGSLQVGTNAVTLNSAGFARSGTLTTIQTAGTLAAPNGLLLDNGDNLTGSGTVIAPIAAGFGSRIFVGKGELHLGDPTALDGFFSDGVLEIGQRSVTLHDANEAVLGSLTTLGFGDFAGSLAAANGAVLEFGKNLTGNGIVNTPDDPTTPLINNGSIVGDAPVRPVELSGYVKGVGTMDNVTITGTDAPGFSTARVYRGNVTYGGAVEIEIGGLSPGGGHDQINHSGMAALGGELRIELINGFEPSVGDSFVIMTYSSHTGQFASVTGRGSCQGPVFRVTYNANDVTLSVVDPLPADIDVDGDVGLSDYTVFTGCMTGPDGSVADACRCFDLDQNGTVDVRDFGGLQAAFTGESR